MYLRHLSNIIYFYFRFHFYFYFYFDIIIDPYFLLFSFIIFICFTLFLSFL